MNVLTKFKPVTTILMDMDGVLTDGSLLIQPDGEWVRRMHIKDGYVLQLAVRSGYRLILVTGSFSQPVVDRLHTLGITEVYQKIQDKAACLRSIQEKYRLKKEEIMFIGDDIPDLMAMEMAGISCCPADAARDVLDKADYISSVKGGEGCVRDILEKLLRVQGKWNMQNDIRST
ncbi:MAG: KdsC family phosphatase [Sphingobacteriales bacterium]|jgi:3-deoxy-D-manno-octulosonate 8-phosphate phosphatase (KDO 8-P phosphatase)